MEARLRNDVLREAASMGGRLLVAREAARSELSNFGPELNMQDDYEPVSGVSPALLNPGACAHLIHPRY